MIRLLHLGDLHPNNAATFAGKTILDPQSGLNQALIDLRRSLHFVLRTANEERTRCDAALLTGDLFDSPRPHANEVRVLTEFVQVLADEMPVFVIAGNHDMSTNPNDATALECLSGIRNVFLMERPASHVLDIRGQRIRFFGLPYPTKGRLLTQEIARDVAPEQVTALINECLGAILLSFQAQIEPGEMPVLLAHGSVSNAKVGEQPRSMAHDIQIPLQSCDGFAYVALGHIHAPQQVAPNAWYSGSLMRNGFGEEQEEKGFNLVTLHTGHPAQIEFVRNPHARIYRTLQAVDLTSDVLSEGLFHDRIYRFKDQLNAGDYQTLKPLLDKLQAHTPCLQLDVELLSEDRARDAGMAACPTMEEALSRVLQGTIEESELPAVFEKHQRLVQEVAL